MDTSRRQFLRGALALAGASVVGLAQPGLTLAASPIVAAFLVFTHPPGTLPHQPQGEVTFKGESSDAELQGAIELHALELGRTDPSTRHFDACKLLKYADTSSPALFVAAASATHLGPAKVFVRHQDQSFNTFAFRNVLIQQFDVSCSADSNRPQEDIVLYEGSVDPASIGSTTWRVLL